MLENFFSRTHAWKITPFSWFREFAPPIEKNAPFFAKMGTGVVYVLVEEQNI